MELRQCFIWDISFTNWILKLNRLLISQKSKPRKTTENFHEFLKKSLDLFEKLNYQIN